MYAAQSREYFERSVASVRSMRKMVMRVPDDVMGATLDRSI
jgi:hypothetical protein